MFRQHPQALRPDFGHALSRAIVAHTACRYTTEQLTPRDPRERSVDDVSHVGDDEAQLA